jgi:hypothetical protein
MGQKDVVWILVRWLVAWFAVRALGFSCGLHPAEIDEPIWLRWARAIGWHPIGSSLGVSLIAWAVRGHPHPEEPPRPVPGEDSPSIPGHALFEQL